MLKEVTTAGFVELRRRVSNSLHLRCRKFDGARTRAVVLGVWFLSLFRDQGGTTHRADPYVKDNATDHSLSNSSAARMVCCLIGRIPRHSQRQTERTSTASPKAHSQTPLPSRQGYVVPDSLLPPPEPSPDPCSWRTKARYGAPETPVLEPRGLKRTFVHC